VLLASADAILILYLQDKGLCRLEAVVIGLIAVVAACLGMVLAMAPPEGGALLRGFVPDQRIFSNPELLYLAIGIVGATVMPHNIYLQSWLVKDSAGTDKRAAIRASSACTIGAMSLAFFINAAILVVAASVFHQAGRADVTDIRDAHSLLSPLVGTATASTLFALALLAAGLNATFTATLAGQVVMEGFLKIRIPAWQRRLFTRLLALIPALFAVGHGGDGSIGSLLVLSQVVLSIQLPFALLPLLQFSASKRVMGAYAAPRPLVILGWLLCSALVVLVLSCSPTPSPLSRKTTYGRQGTPEDHDELGYARRSRAGDPRAAPQTSRSSSTSTPHVTEVAFWTEITDLIDNDVLRHLAKSISEKQGVTGLMNTQPGLIFQDVGGRIPAPALAARADRGRRAPSDRRWCGRAMDAMGIDYTVVFPTPMLTLGMHPLAEAECSSATRSPLAHRQDHSAGAAHQGAGVPAVQRSRGVYPYRRRFGEKPGVIGFTVTSTRYKAGARQRVHAAVRDARGARPADHVPLRLQLGRRVDEAMQPLHLDALDLVRALQPGAPDELDHQRAARALPEAEGGLDRERPRVGAVHDAAARPRVPDALVGSAAAEAKAERLHARDVLQQPAARAQQPEADPGDASKRSTPRRSCSFPPTGRTGTSTCQLDHRLPFSPSRRSATSSA
jgi:hypothetical protein